MPSVVTFLETCANWGPIASIRDSQRAMPIVQSVHLVALTILLATMLVLNLRLAGLAMRDAPLSWIARQLRPWTLGGLALVVLSGMLMFIGTPVKYLGSNPFRVKMVALGIAVICQFAVFRRFFPSEPATRSRALNLVVAGISLTLWFTIGWAGRAIAFLP
jgi:uncharacterized protein DUF6644